MKKVLVLGCCGAGKSTFSLQLAKKIHLPIIHLDQHYFRPNWQEPATDAWRNTVYELCQAEQWIMDGNYGGTLDIRSKYADTVIFLDNSTPSNLYRVIKRTLKYHGKVRPDLAPDCKERFDLEFLFYVLHFNQVKRPSILKRIRQHFDENNLFILKNDAAREAYLQGIPQQ